MSGDTVFVRDQQGNILEGPASQLDAAIKAGGEQVSSADVAKQENAEKYSGVGNTLAAGGLGALDMLSLGLGPAAIGSLGGEDTKQYIEGVSEAHPFAHGVGEVLGAIAPAFLTGGASLAEEAPEIGGSLLRSGAKALAAPMDALGAGGELVSKGVRGVLGDGAIGRIAGGTARGMAEGGFIGATQQAGEDILGDRELTAERLLAGAGRGALFGGAFGGGLSTLGVAGESALSKLADSMDGGVADKLAGKAEELRLASTGAKTAEIRKIEASGLTRNEVGRWMFDELPKFSEGGKYPVSREAIGEAAQRAAEDAQPRISGAIDQLDTAGARPNAATVIDRLRNDVIAPLDKKLGMESVTARLNTIVDKAESRLQQNPTFRELFDLRKDLDDLAYRDRKVLDQSNAMQQLREARRAIEDEIGKQGERFAGPQWKEGYDAAKRQFRMATTVQETVERAQQRIAGNRGISLTDTIAGGFGFAHLGPVGLLAGAVNHAIREYGDAVGAHLLDKASKLQALRGMSLDFGDATTKAVRGFLNAAHGGSTSGLVRVASKYEDKKERIEQLATNPAMLAAAASKHVPAADVAPKTSALVAQKMAGAVGYLHGQLPPEVNTRSPLTPQLSSKSSKAAQTAWLRKLDVYEDPLSVLDDMKKGRLHPDKADALKTMFPALYGDVQKAIAAEVADGASRGKEPNFKQRMQMGILFGVPTDAMLDPSFLQSQQALYQNPPQEDDNLQQKAPGALANLELHDADDERTQSERLEAGTDR